MFKKRVIDEFLQKWYNEINMCNYLPMLKYCKINFGYEMYLDTLPTAKCVNTSCVCHNFLQFFIFL